MILGSPTRRSARMRFSIYSEMQSWPGKPYAQLYQEVLEQIENADRLGFDAYAIIEHFFFPKFSASPDPMAFFAAAAPLRVLTGRNAQRPPPGRGRRGLGHRRPAAAPVRGAARAARPLPRHVPGARQRAGHRLDPRLLSRRGSGHGDPRGRGGDQGLP